MGVSRSVHDKFLLFLQPDLTGKFAHDPCAVRVLCRSVGLCLRLLGTIVVHLVCADVYYFVVSLSAVRGNLEQLHFHTYSS